MASAQTRAPLPRAEHGEDLRLGPIPPAVLQGLDEDFILVFGAVKASCNAQVIPERAVGGDPLALLVHVDGAGHRLFGPGHNALDPAAGTLVPLLQVREDDGVPHEGALQSAARDKDILPAQLGTGKAKAL